MKLLYRLLRQQPDSREGVIVTTSALGILVNLLLGLTKILIGVAASSIAILSEGMNNAADFATSLMALLSARLSAMHPTAKHPFGFGRVEYLSSLLISLLILLTGAELLAGSVHRIFAPQPLSVSYGMLAVIGLSAVVKLILGSFTIRQGRRIGCGSLVAVGVECRADCLVSAVTILSALVFLLFRLSLDAYAGVFASLFVLRSGAGVLRDSLSALLGQRGEGELAGKLYAAILQEPLVRSAADLVLHNYGPGTYSGSVNIEVDHEKTVAQVYAAIHALQLKIRREYNVAMVFGLCPTNHEWEELGALRQYIAAYVRDHDHLLGYHALYMDVESRDISCDLVVDYELLDQDALRRDFTAYLRARYPESQLWLAIETNFV